MKALQGKGVSPGVAVGPLRMCTRQALVEEKRPITDPRQELKRFTAARDEAAAALERLAPALAGTLGEENALLFEIHKMMLEDEDYTGSVEEIILGEAVWAEYAVSETARRLARRFAAMEDETMRARAADVEDISLRVLAALAGRAAGGKAEGPPAVLYSDDFTPSETAGFARGEVLAMLTRQGAANSHTAIFARTMCIPAVIGLGDALGPGLDGCTVIVNGETGEVLLDPDGATLAKARRRQCEEEDRRTRQQALKGKAAVTPDGQTITLCANIGGAGDARLALENGAEGIGLLRSELLYLQSQTYPTEEEQLAVYRAVAEMMDGRRVVIRTLDVGADKQIGYFGLRPEENPALGYRAIRICLDRPELFLTQLRAIYRASAFGRVAILLPMVTGPGEVRRAKALAAQAREDLRTQGIPFDEKVELGVMIETPAAAMVSDMLADEADFFSVGTNDLTQYTLAADRQNPALEPFFDPHHTGLLRLVKLAAANAHAKGKWIGICGELAADESLTELFLAMGIDELSVVPASILPLRERVRRSSPVAARARLLEQLDWQ